MVAGFCDHGCATGRLIVDGFALASYAWDIPDLTPLWYAHSKRGGNLLLPSAPGQRGFPQRLDMGEYQLQLFVTGDADRVGTPFADPWHGLRHNLDDLWANVFAPVSTGTGTRPCVLEVPGGANRTADCQFMPLDAARVEDPRLAVFTFSLVVPAGRFV